jgi:cytochrome P450
MNAMTNSAKARVDKDIARIIVDPKSYTDDNVIYPALKWVRENAPLGYAEVDGFDPMWIVSKHADIMTVGKQPAVFSNEVQIEVLCDKANVEFIKFVTNGSPHLVNSLTSMDPPKHTLYRSLTSSWFAPANVRRLEEKIRPIAKASVDRLLAHDMRCDFMRDCALYYPLHVVMSVLGVPEEDEPFMLRLTQDFFGAHDPEEQRQESAPSPEAMAKQIQASLTTAGHDTTSSTSGGAMLGMAKFKDQFELVKKNSDYVPNLIEEALRWTAPVKHFMRTATTDTVLAGQEIRAGDRLMLSYPSANRDEDVFQNADDFDILRSQNRHLSFGWGVHMCLGQHLGKLEMRVFFEELLPKLKSFELDGEPKFVETNFVGGPKKLPIRFEKV